MNENITPPDVIQEILDVVREQATNEGSGLGCDLDDAKNDIENILRPVFALTARVTELEALLVDVTGLMREMSTQNESGAAARLYFEASERMFWRVETVLAKYPSVRADGAALNKEPT